MFETAQLATHSGQHQASSVLLSGLAQSGLVATLLIASMMQVAPMPVIETVHLLPPLHAVRKPNAQPSRANAAVRTSALPAAAKPFTAPLNVPDQIVPVNDLDSAPAAAELASLPGNGAGDGVISIVGALPSAVGRVPDVPPVPAAKPPAQATPSRIVVHSGVQASMLSKQITPVYPPIAVRARIEGKVVLQGIVGTDGRVAALQVLSGHPLLRVAALDAVRQWVYRPTQLNGKAVEVATTIDVNFVLR